MFISRLSNEDRLLVDYYRSRITNDTLISEQDLGEDPNIMAGKLRELGTKYPKDMGKFKQVELEYRRALEKACNRDSAAE